LVQQTVTPRNSPVRRPLRPAYRCLPWRSGWPGEPGACRCAETLHL